MVPTNFTSNSLGTISLYPGNFLRFLYLILALIRGHVQQSGVFDNQHAGWYRQTFGSPETSHAISSVPKILSTVQTALHRRFSVCFLSRTSNIGSTLCASHNISTPCSTSTPSSNRVDNAASAASTTFSIQ
ncbi:hypothetical protein Ddye_007447 [Dipteronia dyeriana]|uniref:Uncharacterized protein n=1 Tax=Dipteronia dyeriana TaxID=168575 RepID=A0AAD9XJY7_9ROSI|nr:hypothetical protein Ddye_007447 [Dipteronia dyeriana]